MSKKRKFIRFPLDEISQIQAVARVNTHVLASVQDKQDFDYVAKFLSDSRTLFKGIDAKMVQICPELELVEWANRARMINDRFDTIERNLAVRGTRLFEWDRVLEAMGMITACRVGAQQTIALNESPEEN